MFTKVHCSCWRIFWLPELVKTKLATTGYVGAVDPRDAAGWHKAVCRLMSPCTQGGVPAHVATQSGVPAHVTTQSGVPAHVEGKTAVCPFMSSKQTQDFFGPRFYTRTHFMIFALLWNVFVIDKNQVFLKKHVLLGKTMVLTSLLLIYTYFYLFLLIT